MRLNKIKKTTLLIKIPSFFIFFIGLFLSNANAKNLGTMGQTYPIQEIDLLEFIQSKAFLLQQNGELQKLQNKMRLNAVSYRDRPKAVDGIQHATQTKSWVFDPGILLDHALLTPDGKVIAYAGTYVNPLKTISLSKMLVFYDADDPKEISWVNQLNKALKGGDKLILVKGSILNEERRFSKPVYFDQEGRITAHFGIQHVPATIHQEGLSLRITEVKL